MGAEARLLELGIDLAEGSHPVANYEMVAASGRLLFVSGHGPVQANGALLRGKVGDAFSLEQAYEAARLAGLAVLATLRGELGSLDRVSRIVKVLGMVNCAPGFNRMPEVIDGCSDLLIEVFGDNRGRHARSAIGVAELPFDIPVEIELVCEIE
ncbi:MAG: RidA family protein [Acidobacteria bacterium]|nr:RidA family protein [Acidobacteriota bacterium]